MLDEASPCQGEFMQCLIVRIVAQLIVPLIFLIAHGAFAATTGSTNVVTYHYDGLRTGWDATETTLTPASVGSAGFGLLAQVALDEQVDAQPLFVSGQQIAGGTHDVIYVATENNTIYAIDASDAAILAQQNFGAGVPIEKLYDQCSNNADHVGIGSTPVIDLSTNTLYAITYTLEHNKRIYRIHAIDLGTLADQVPSVVVSGGGTLTNGRSYEFDGYYNRQRTALLETSGAIYAGFSGWCDLGGNVSRGWVMGWHTGTLAPLPLPKLMNRAAHTPNRFFLTSVWMSGYGIASDGRSLYFTSANSDPAGKSYNSTTNLDESVVKLSTDLARVQGFFTPEGGQDGWSNLDKSDGDFSAGGVLVLPDQPGRYPHLAIAAGKVGPMYLLNRDHLGGLGPEKVTLGRYANYGCWCGQSYYVGSDGVGRVVESTGVVSIVWKIVTSPRPKLVAESYSPHLQNMQDPGFFTTISSNGTTPNTQIIWAVQRPYDPNTNEVALLAFDPSNNSNQIFSGVAGTWPFAKSANANLVPVVANGHVFVASYKNISGFGMFGGRAKPVVFHPPAASPARGLPPGVTHEVRGIVTALDGTSLSLRLRDGRTLRVDMQAAQAAFDVVPIVPGRAVDVRGDDRDGVLVARSILHQKQNPLTWDPDK
jgi:hypothetical protein